MSDWFHVASLFLFYLNSALLRLNPLAPAVTRRTKSIAPAVTRRIELFEFRFDSCKKFLLFSEFSCKM
mgnify:CR=1 FL=1